MDFSTTTQNSTEGVLNSTHDSNITTEVAFGYFYVPAAIPYSVRIAGITTGILLVATGIPGNIMLMIASLLKPRDHGQGRMNTPEILVFSLAATDAFFLAVKGSLNIHTYLVGTWIFGQRTCTLLFMTLQMCHTLALEHIIAITLCRYLLVVHSKGLSPTWYGTVLLLAVIYAVPLALTMSFMTRDAMVFFPVVMTCLSMATVTGENTKPVFAIFGMLIIVGVGVLLCYIHIYIHVRRSRSSVNSLPGDDPAGNGNSAEAAKTRAAFVRREVKLIRTIAYVFLSFCLTYPVSPLLLTVDPRVQWSLGVHYIGVFTDTMTGCLNWVIYGLTNDWVRKRYRQIITCDIWRGRHKRRRVAPGGNTASTRSTTKPSTSGAMESRKVQVPPVQSKFEQSEYPVIRPVKITSQSPQYYSACFIQNSLNS